ncbi:6-phosphogluconolactonase [Aldersonia sp. NBC_00410]|uniref:6-phosphogluconolactonase n=1 Tax=Aldersonia sp. NBC_00410 TaxID=2975954 RepID=UPI00225978AA|nr:6-phosphogluconolactonase [Aldersonia sp. NBC_00410]MCX5045177.1 6-phosphogluconolactonase [Aldersonia sp. NBC_00410]
MSEQIVERFSDTDALVSVAAERFVAVVTAAQAERGSASVVLTGGGAGIALLEKLRADSGSIDWSAVDVFWGDERFVPATDPERNELQAREALLDHVGVDHSRVHPMAASDGEYPDPVVAAAEYARVLADRAVTGGVPEFDLHLLGMGGEGHVNSLFPHTDAVREEHDLVIAVMHSPKPPPVRITLTLPAVRRSRQVWLLVTGDAKAEAAAAAIGGADPDDIPAAGARGTEATVWFLDEAAAGKLP